MNCARAAIGTLPFAFALTATACKHARNSRAAPSTQTAPSESAASVAAATSSGAFKPPRELYVRYEPLGPHYRLKHYGVRSMGFEGIAHYTALLFGDRELSSSVDFPDLSPDGWYVVYADGRGHNFVHSAHSGKTRSVTPKPYAIPTRTDWDLEQGKVTVRFRSPIRPITVSLP